MTGGESALVDNQAVASLAAMGFSDAQATKALRACDGNLERAADWIFSHMDELDSAIETVCTEISMTSVDLGLLVLSRRHQSPQICQE